MHPVGIVPDEPVNELGVEDLRRPQIGYVVVDEFLLNGAVEPLAMRIHLRRLGICMVMTKDLLNRSWLTR